MNSNLSSFIINMILSSSMLKMAVENFQQKRLKERYSKSKSVVRGVNAASAVFILIVVFLFFFMELIVLYYAIRMAIDCTQSGPERIVNVVLAVTFTIPYVTLNILFNQCAKYTLRNGGVENGTSPI